MGEENFVPGEQREHSDLKQQGTEEYPTLIGCPGTMGCMEIGLVMDYAPRQGILNGKGNP